MEVAIRRCVLTRSFLSWQKIQEVDKRQKFTESVLVAFMFGMDGNRLIRWHRFEKQLIVITDQGKHGWTKIESHPWHGS